MGNRAVIAYESMPEVGIYVHWNGGLESILAFLEETRKRGARTPGGDKTYSLARLCQTIIEFFSSDGDYQNNVGIGLLSALDCDNHDNGLYWIGEDWKIVRREHARESDASRLTVDDLSPSERGQYEAMLEMMESFRVIDER